MAEWEAVSESEWESIPGDTSPGDMATVQRGVDRVNLEQHPMTRYEQSLNPLQQGLLGFDEFVGQPARGISTFLGDVFGADEWAKDRRRIDAAGAQAWDETADQRASATKLGGYAGMASTMGLPGKLYGQAAWSGAQEFGESAATTEGVAGPMIEGAQGLAWGYGFGKGSDYLGRLLAGVNSSAKASYQWMKEKGASAIDAAGPDPRITSMASDFPDIEFGGKGIDPPAPPGGGGGPPAGGARGGSPDRWQNEAEELGFSLGRADQTGSPVTIALERGTSNNPATMDILSERYDKNAQVLAAHVAEGLGVPADPLGRITVSMRQDALNQIEDTYSSLRSAIEQNGGIDIDSSVVEDIANAASNTQIGSKAINSLVTDFKALSDGGKLSAKDWSSIRSRIRKEAKAFSNNGQQDAADELYGLSTYLDDGVNEMLGGPWEGLRDEYMLARSRYRNYLAVERANVVSKETEELNPTTLYNSLARIKGRQFTLNQSDEGIDRAAFIAPRLQRRRGGSDTALNLYAQNVPGNVTEIIRRGATRPIASAYLNGKNPMLDYLMGDFSGQGLMVKGGGSLERAMDPDI